MKYIDADALKGTLLLDKSGSKEALRRREGLHPVKKLEIKALIDAISYCVDEINKIPTADVVEVRHGEWKKSQFSGRSGFYSVRDVVCSECGIYSTFLQHEIRPDYYCPNCGAKMDGGVTE